MPQPPADKPIGIPFIELQSVDSTNNYARRLIQGANWPDFPAGDGPETGQKVQSLHGTAIFSHEQVAGRGQRGKTWKSEKNANIILSIVINPGSLPYEHGQFSGQFHLSATVATALHEFFEKYAGDPTAIKWPNDLFWQDRKAGGILIESGISSNQTEPQSPGKPVSHLSGNSKNEQEKIDPVVSGWNWAIIGIGININQTRFPPDILNAVSLKQITGKDFSTIELAREICQALDKKIILLKKEGFKGIYEYYLEHLYKKNMKMRFKNGSRVFDATVKGVSETGKLIVQHSIEEEFDFGTIEWIP